MGISERNIEVIDDTMARILREKTTQQRLSAKKQLTNYLQSEHPDWDDIMVQREVVKRLSHGIA